MRAKISIVTPVLNGQKYVGEALQSMLDQTYQNFELILVNDGSTDGTEAIVRSFMDRMDIKIVHHPKPLGIARSVNDGLSRTCGEYICFLDHDDTWFPEFLETQLRHLEEHPDVGMVHADFQTIDPSGAVIEASVASSRKRARPSGHVFRDLFFDSFIVANSVLIRREVFDRLGGFDETLLWGDYHMWLRIARHYKVDYVPKVLTKYRQHPTQSTRGNATGEAAIHPVAALAINKLLAADPAIRKDLGEDTVARRLAALYFELGHTWWTKGAGSTARACIGKAIGYRPGVPRHYLLYAATLLPHASVSAAKAAVGRIRGIGSSGDMRPNDLKKVS